MKKPIVIMGATASGKTDIAAHIARLTGGEIISCDSRQIYKHLTHGTAKPDGKWQDGKYIHSGVAHYLLDFLEPSETYACADFVKDASAAAKQISARKKQIIFAGGTGLYIQSYFLGIDEMPPADAAVRQQIEREIAQKGAKILHTELSEIDPRAAEKIPFQNTQRLVRALEVCRTTGKPISSFWTKGSFNTLPGNKADYVLINWDKPLLERRIARRTEMIFDGMRDETARLSDMGYKKNCPALKSLGYAQIIDFLDGKTDKKTAIEKITALTRAYAKRQNTWFRRYKNAAAININDEKNYKCADIAKQILSLISR